MIERRPLAAGSFTVPLRNDTPYQTLDWLDLASAGFGLVCVLSGHLDPSAVTAEAIIDNSIYVGVYRRLGADGLSLEGAGLEILLGDEDDKGPRSDTESTGATDRTFKQWIDLWPSISTGFNGLDHTGNIENIGGLYKLVMKSEVTARVWLDHVCRHASTATEWRVRNNLTLHAGTVSYLYPTATTPTVVVTRESESRDLNIRGLQADISGDSDVEDWTETTQVVYADDAAMLSATIASNPYTAPDGSALVMSRVIDGNDNASADTAQLIADTEQARSEGVRRQIGISIDTFDIASDVNPGDTVYVYDPRLGYVDTDNQIPYRGEIIFPTTMRVHGMTWPIRQGMGVHLVVGGTSGDVFDLTDWVAFEDGPAALEVGAPRRNLLRTQRRGAAA